MIPTLDLIAAIGGLIIPPAADIIKKKLIKSENDTPERTIGSLATTSPETLPKYVEALGSYYSGQVQWFNRDVLGQPSQWIVDLRAAIRPVTVCACLALLGADLFGGMGVTLNDGLRVFCEAAVTSWMGSRLVQR